MLRSQVSGIHEIVPSCPCNTVQANNAGPTGQKNYRTCLRINRITADGPAAYFSAQKIVLDFGKKTLSVSFAKLLAYRPHATLHIAQRKLQEGLPLEDHLCVAGDH